jgi:hypothetical protein
MNKYYTNTNGGFEIKTIHSRRFFHLILTSQPPNQIIVDWLGGCANGFIHFEVKSL